MKNLKIKSIEEKSNAASPNKGYLPEIKSVNTKKKGVGVLTIILLALIFGAAGSVLFQSFIFPHLDKLPFISDYGDFGLRGQKIIIERQEIIKDEEENKAHEAWQKIKPAVVMIVPEYDLQIVGDNYSLAKSGTSGMILTSDGLVVTAAEIKEGVDYKVVDYENKIFSVARVLTDQLTGLHVLETDMDNCQAVDFGIIDDIFIGQRIILANNNQRADSLEIGELSKKNISLLRSTGAIIDNVFFGSFAKDNNLVGSPLFDYSGKVLGIYAKDTVDGEEVFYVVPEREMRYLIKTIADSGDIKRTSLGIRYVYLEDLARETDDDKNNHGAMVYAKNKVYAAVDYNSPAALAGITKGDIIKKIGEYEVSSRESINKIMEFYNKEEVISVGIEREGELLDFEISLKFSNL